MKRSKKCWLGNMSIILMVALTTAGCANGNEAATQLPTSNNKQESSDNFGTEAPIEITWANSINPPDNNNNYVQQQIESKFNVKIKNVRLERSTWKEKFNVLLASGQIPDIFPVDADMTDMATWADQGLIASIPREEIEKHMPKYAIHLKAEDPGAWEVGLYQGKYWGIPKVWPPGNDGLLPGYNENWLKEIGYNEPPKTLDELHDVLTKFVNDDPDGNDRKDTYGMTARGQLPIQMFTSIFSAYGVSPYLFINDDDGGGVVYGGITEQTRSALKTLNQWYEEGLIDPEFITADNHQINEKFVNQKIGYVDNLGWISYYKDSAYITKPALEKGIQVVAGTPLIGPAGKPYAFSSGSRQAPLMLGVQLEEDDKKRQKIEQILEWVSTNPEGWLMTTQGVEGVNYDMVEGKAVPRTGTEANVNKTGAGSFYNPLVWINKDFIAEYSTKQDALELEEKINRGYIPLRDDLQAAVLETKTKYWPHLQTLQDTYLIKAVIGEENTDSDFDTFKAQWLKTGGQALTDEVSQVYAERSRN
ncbi:extracellular solute-binding protein [Paenibacillus sp. p3-SID867]|uniref:extracellular solute-binding protein n=1 Tax=Paenibacillus sp. p3-SID867 TaxID=2916363 RepID=UPI0021A3B796|nr:extracellular solute-binding protein [Paenibacillus sp. p3-SID867]MCT1402970.1 extracellular solute-binding protein [Paenibacillus sp. p3-SID867]